MLFLRSRFLPVLFTLAILGAACGALDAQISKADLVPPGAIRLRVFIAHQQQQTLPDWALLDLAKNSVPLSFIEGTISLPILVAGGDRLSFYPRAALEKALADKAELPGSAQEFPLQQGGVDYLLVLQPGAKENDWSYTLLPSDIDAFPPGSILMFNLTAFPFVGKVGADTVQIPPRGRTIFRPAINPNDPGMEILFQTIQAGQPRMFLHQRWTPNPAMRAITVFWDFGDGDIRTSVVSDTPPPPPPKPSGAH